MAPCSTPSGRLGASGSGSAGSGGGGAAIQSGAAPAQAGSIGRVGVAAAKVAGAAPPVANRSRSPAQAPNGVLSTAASRAKPRAIIAYQHSSFAPRRGCQPQITSRSSARVRAT